MSATATTQQQLLSARLERDVVKYVAAQRSAGHSYESIARTITTATGVTVSGETLRRWHA